MALFFYGDEMTTTDTCNPLRNDVDVAFGENHTFALSFKTNRDLSNAKCTLTIKANNSDTVEVYRDQQSVVGDRATFTLTPSQCRDIGAGRFWYDIWVIDGADFEKPIVMGVFNIPMLTTRSQA